ncbi:MAG: hypothetical protein ACXVY8_02835 [Gaiellaceae bacterium]
MDLLLFLRVLKRFWYVVVPGIALALGLGYAEYRHTRGNEQWVSYSKVFVTQRGFPWGSIESGSTQLANQQKLSSLAILYSQLAISDKVQGAILLARKHGSIQAAPVLTQQGSGDALPLISIAAIDNSPGHAVQLATSETSALLSYIAEQQAQALIPVSQRVVLQVLTKPDLAGVRVFSKPSKAVPIVILLTVLMAVIALAFVLENVLPRTPRASEPETVAPTSLAPTPSQAEHHPIMAATPAVHRSPSGIAAPPGQPEQLRPTAAPVPNPSVS